jgi:arsenite methyltransferase
MTTGQEIKQEVKKRYGAAAKRAQEKSADAGCCGSVDESVITSNLYATDELQHLPQEAVVASLGCGNPVAVAELREGETVLDLGSGGGIDVLLSARRVGPTGKAYGLDMTDEMLALAGENAAKAGVSNVEFLRGEMEKIPLPSETVDVIISNCVVNLSPDKDAVLREARRVLRPGGRLAIADIVTKDDLPEQIKSDMKLWTGCIAGALTLGEYTEKLASAGFEDVDIETFREYTAADAGSTAAGAAEGVGVFSGVVRARKAGGERRDWGKIEVVAGNAQAGACGPDCC